MELDQDLFQGVWTPIITPFDENDIIMLGTIKKHIENLTDTHHSGIILFDPIGEGQSLSYDEKIKILTEIRASFENLKIILAVISTSQKDAIKLIKKAEEIKIDGLLLYSPYDYGKISTSKLAEYFSGIMKVSQLPVIIAHMDNLTHVSISTPLLRALLRNQNFIGVADYSLNLNFLQMANKSFKSLKIFSGNEYTHEAKIAAGSKGIVSYLCNIYPSLLCGQISFQKQDLGEIQDIYLLQTEKMKKILKIIENYPMPDVLKYLLYLQGFPSMKTRVPLETLNENQKSKLKTDIGVFLQKNRVNE